MDLKEYQQKALDQIRLYLVELYQWKCKCDEIAKIAGNEAIPNWTEKAWIKIRGGNFYSRTNGLNEYLPNFCLKVPTGGGKTLLAVKTIDLINTIFRKKKNGLFLWVVPSNQIYRQTIQNLRNREHPYRQFLDIASGGRTLILQKTDNFTPDDIKQNLVILMLMLPSAARQNKETLKVFRDSGGFQPFFPAEDNHKAQKQVLDKFPNLDTFGEGGFWGKQIKTSLGNALRIITPTIILDEGHKAYSDTAQKTLRNFNPEMVVELSATPSPKSNVLVDIKGTELSRDQMIKLDLHVTNKSSVDWKDTVLSGIEKRNFLEEKAKDYEANTGIYIRPICLIQVERTGKDQRGSHFIHSEEVKEHLIKVCGISETAIAIKSSEKDDIEGIDLLSKNCNIRYIITKQALQEGWDCSFAYVLMMLTNPASETSVTQLVGRILRQPYAKKTKIKELDESYVYCFQQRGKQLLDNIKRGFEHEGLGDIAGHVISEDLVTGPTNVNSERTFEVRDKFKKASAQIYLPVFVINNGKSWIKLDYEGDLLRRIDWGALNFDNLKKIQLSSNEEKDTEIALGLSENEKEVIEHHGFSYVKEGGLVVDPVFITRHLIDIIPNPWVAYNKSATLFKSLIARHGEKVVANNLVFIIEEMRKEADLERDRLAKNVFVNLLAKKVIGFLILKELEYRLPAKIKIKKTSKRLTAEDGSPLEKSLFEAMPEDEFNSTEMSVAWYLEEQAQLFWWYRNISRQDYSIQGWRKQRIYPDFIFSKKDTNEIHIIETKGLHLKNNDDSKYKQEIFTICNSLGKQMVRAELGFSLPKNIISFKIISEDEWQNRINEILS